MSLFECCSCTPRVVVVVDVELQEIEKKIIPLNSM